MKNINEKQKQLAQEIFWHYGIEKQLDKLIEESMEFANEWDQITIDNEINRPNEFISELVDLKIMLYQINYFIDNCLEATNTETRLIFDQLIDFKLDRTIERITNETNSV